MKMHPQTELKQIRNLDIGSIPLPGNAYPSHSRYLKKSLEIGAGVGMHALSFAKNNSDYFHIAIERTSNKFQKLSHRSMKEDLDNLYVCQDDAVNWVVHNTSELSFDKIHILYPNPYPKNHSARWVRMPFFRLLLKKLKTEGEIQFASNIESYMQEVLLYCENYWNLELVKKETLIMSELDDSYKPLTHFEKKYLERGETCYHYSFKKSK